MRIGCVGYRDWALGIYDKLVELDGHEFLIARSRDEFSVKVFEDFSPDLILFYGWSWVIPQSLLDLYTCVMLHPSNLPLYRGGSPIQNQIMDGVVDSKVTLFIMSEKIDAGDIIAQANLDLSVSLTEIFSQLQQVGLALTIDILVNGYKRMPQDDRKATYCKRRTPAESEITLDELKSKSSVDLYNKVRMLADPYPNAFIRTSDGRKLVLKSVEVGD